MRFTPIVVLVIIIALVSAAAAGVELSLSNGPRGENAPTAVLVATRFIPAGTPFKRIVPDFTYTTGWMPTTGRGALAEYRLPEGRIDDGDPADSQYLTGRVTVRDICPGQQLEAKFFGSSTEVVPLPPRPELLPGIQVTIECSTKS